MLQPSPELHDALDSLAWLASQVQGMEVSIDLADLRGYAYYTGMRFAMFSHSPQGEAVELARGGRYDEVGAVFGRNRPAVGFSLDVKELVSAVAPRPAGGRCACALGHGCRLARGHCRLARAGPDGGVRLARPWA